ncbi:hypothetical protein M2454_000971 [Aequitasia blattaphilus]|uniref:Four helix bundle protein n=1 Tax=Aequitasia blattaphilus TaxID=2949332 RepID=A0ABT1E9B1_9FIRM|nr:four helix bundle protein [Aequitasia blattaphilus]MCP1102421.1 four helix bundle protein [Aequitasia blattaphilus]MCR8615061.1 four helix bundle protein [Aequitasia blattaphilus]
MSEQEKSELLIITKAKDLCSYVMVITEKCPKRFRFTYVSRLQNLALEVVEHIYRANDIFLGGVDVQHNYERRLAHQRQAFTDLRLLGYMTQASLEQKCIIAKQYEMISRQVFDCQNLLGAWMNSDKRRMMKQKNN